MLNLKTTLSAIVLSAGLAAAASPGWVNSAITNVHVTANYTGGSSPYSEGTPVFFINLGGTLYASYYNSDRTKAMYEMAKSAAAAGKSVSIYRDTDNVITVTSCGDYDSSGCIYKNSATNYATLQEIAIIP